MVDTLLIATGSRVPVLSSTVASSVTGKVRKVCRKAGRPLPKMEISSQTSASSARVIAVSP